MKSFNLITPFLLSTLVITSKAANKCSSRGKIEDEIGTVIEDYCDFGGLDIVNRGSYNLVCSERSATEDLCYDLHYGVWNIHSCAEERPCNTIDFRFMALSSKSKANKVKQEWESTNQWKCKISSGNEEIKISADKCSTRGKKKDKKGTIIEDYCDFGGWDITNRSSYNLVCAERGASEDLCYDLHYGVWNIHNCEEERPCNTIDFRFKACSSKSEANKKLKEWESTGKWKCKISKAKEEIRIPTDKCSTRGRKNDKKGMIIEDYSDFGGWDIVNRSSNNLICLKRGGNEDLCYDLHHGVWNIHNCAEERPCNTIDFRFMACSSKDEANNLKQEWENTGKWKCEITSDDEEIKINKGPVIDPPVEPSQPSPPSQPSQPSQPGKVKEVMDLSVYNEVIDYDAASKSVDGVILRAGYRGYGSAGNIVKDSRFETHYNGFKGKIKIGYYFFTQATTVKEAIEEADAFHNFIKDKAKPDLPLFWDTENSGASRNGDIGRADNLNVYMRTECAIAFINRIKELGYTPGIYASEYWYRDNLDYERIVATGASIWVANYSNKPKTRVYDAWQFSSKESIDGIVGNVDRSHVYANW